MALQRFCAWITFVLYFNVALATGHLYPRDTCDDIAPYLSSFSSYPQATVNSFCSSLLDNSNALVARAQTITVTRRVRMPEDSCANQLTHCSDHSNTNCDDPQGCSNLCVQTLYRRANLLKTTTTTTTRPTLTVTTVVVST